MTQPAETAITALSARDLSAAIHARTLSCAEVMAAYLDRIGPRSYQDSCIYHQARGCGLTRDSVILLEQVRTLDKSRLRERMGRLDEPAMHQVDNAIAVSFGLPQ